jgi:hypothetical protein
MKKSALSLILMCMLSAMAFGQSMANKKKAKIDVNEVPVAVRSSFERDFGQTPGDGAWFVYFSTTRSEGKMVASPIWYTFTAKSPGDKIEVRYLPDGKLKSAHGIAKKDVVRESGQQPSGEKPSTTM